MITITQPQLARIAAMREEAFVAERLGLLRARSGRDDPDPALHDAALALLRRARGHDLSRTDDLIAFITLGLTYGEAFDAHPPFAAILNDPRWDPRRRMAVLLTCSRDEDWRALAPQTG